MKLSTYIKHLTVLQKKHGDLEVVRGYETAPVAGWVRHCDSEVARVASAPDIKGVVKQEDMGWGTQEIIVHVSKKHDRKVIQIA